MNNENGSITHWIHEIQHGNREAAQQLWEKYFTRLVAFARFELKNGNQRVSDEEDIALSTFETFYRCAENGRYPDLADRNGLWRLLVKIAANKAIDHQRKEGRQRRGGGKIRGESVFQNEFGEQIDELAQVIGNEPSPDFVVAIREQFDRLIGLLEEDELKQIAIAKLEGYSIKEISERTNRSIRTIERRLHLIRKKFDEEYQN